MKKRFLHREVDYAVTGKPHAEGDPAKARTGRFSEVTYTGEGPLNAQNLEGINRRDTPKQVISGGPVTLNQGESIFQQYPRRVDEGKTIRCQEDER